MKPNEIIKGTIRLKHIFERLPEKNNAAKRAAVKVTVALRRTEWFRGGDEELRNIIEAFGIVFDVKSFNFVLDRLYDWADAVKVLIT